MYKLFETTFKVSVALKILSFLKAYNRFSKLSCFLWNVKNSESFRKLSECYILKYSWIFLRLWKVTDNFEGFQKILKTFWSFLKFFRSFWKFYKVFLQLIKFLIFLKLNRFRSLQKVFKVSWSLLKYSKALCKLKKFLKIFHDVT